MPCLIKLNNVCKTYQLGEQTVQALDHVNLTVEQGELLAIIGPSGAGKSTLMDIIGLLDTPSSGEYYFTGDDVAHFDDDARSDLRNHAIGFTFQSFFLLPQLTALENVALPLTYRQLDKDNIKNTASEMLTKVGLADRLNHKPSELSGGQQQRVAIARSLVTKPKIILADEPTGALDSQTSGEIIELLKTLNREHHVTVIIVTHDDTIAAQCPRQIKINDGKITDSKVTEQQHAR